MPSRRTYSVSRRTTHTTNRRASFEELEPRLTLTTFYPTSLADGIAAGSLRHAVLQANASVAADTIVLRRGTYTLSLGGSGEDLAATGDLDIAGTLTIRGAGESRTIIDAAALADRVFDLLAGGNLIIKDATIRGGHAEQGGALLVQKGNLTLIHCRLLDNTAQGLGRHNGLGGAVSVTDGNLTVQDCNFQGNQALGTDDMGSSGWGGGIHLADSVARISSSRFEDNWAAGGAASTEPGSSGGTGTGGAVFGLESDVTVVQSSFKRNSATGGHGRDGDDALAGGDASGGAIGVQGSSLALRKSLFERNTSGGGNGGNGPNGGDGGEARGGAVAAAFTSEVVVDACTFQHNKAGGGDAGNGKVLPPPDASHAGGNGLGGAIAGWMKTDLNVAKSAFRENRAVGGRGGDGATDGEPSYGGDGGSGEGGAVWAVSEGGPDFAAVLTIRQSSLQQNETLGGAGGHGASGDGAGGLGAAGGLLLGTNIDTLLVGVSIQGNRAVGGGPAQGGGINCLAVKLAIVDSLFADNQAVGGTASFGAGGGLSATDTQLNVSGTTFRRNVARGGKGIDASDGGWGVGGAVFLDKSTAVLVRSVFERNQALGGTGGEASNGGNALGGAVSHGDAPEAPGSLDVTSCRFVDNRADGGVSPHHDRGTADGGGVWASPAESLRMTASVVQRNRASGSTGRGGGVFLDDQGSGSAILRLSTVTKNTASTEGNDIFGPYVP